MHAQSGPCRPTVEQETCAQASGMDGPGDEYLALKRLHKGDGMKRDKFFGQNIIKWP